MGEPRGPRARLGEPLVRFGEPLVPLAGPHWVLTWIASGSLVSGLVCGVWRWYWARGWRAVAWEYSASCALDGGQGGQDGG